MEHYWLERLGSHAPRAAPESIIIATQVVEQSVDIDLDFIVSDLAPTDMLLQRMGRLWRHERPTRAAAQPDFWTRLPVADAAGDASSLKRALGRSAWVYAPYVLLRSAAVFAGKTTLTLPDDIRPVLEATYEAPATKEPSGWQELHDELEADKRLLTLNAEAAMRILANPALADEEGVLTRRKGPPTVPVLLLRSVVAASNHTWQLTALDGSGCTVSDYEWRMPSARFLHHWLVRVPKWMVPGDAPRPPWLTLHTSGGAAAATVQDDGRLCFGETVSRAVTTKLSGCSPSAPPRQPLNAMTTMNLIAEPWIPVIGRDSVHRLVGLEELFLQAASIRDLAVKPHERIALWRLLICIAQAGLDGPEDRNAWETCRDEIPDRARAYLRKWKAQFELFGDSARFLQAPDLKPGKEDGEGNDATKLDITLATGHNATVFDNAGGSERARSPGATRLGPLDVPVFLAVRDCRCSPVG